MSAGEPRAGSRWGYNFSDGKLDSFGVAGCISRPKGRTVLTTIGGCPVGGIRMSTWRKWLAAGRLVELSRPAEEVAP